MGKVKDITGRTFGVKEVLGLEYFDASHNAHWKCRCKMCGNITYPTIGNLRKQPSCYCQRPDCADLTGKVFGDRRVLGRDPSVSIKDTMNVWQTECVVCGAKARLSKYDLTHRIRTKCHHEAIFEPGAEPARSTILVERHKARHPLYKVYGAFVRACTIPEDPAYYCIGARGIQICPEWYDPKNPDDDTGFRNFVKWSLEHGYKEYMMPSGRNCCRMVRIDKDQDYTPENCEWRFLKSYLKMIKG